MELFKLELKSDEIEAFIELNEQDVVWFAKHSFFSRRNKGLGTKLINLLAAANKCSVDTLISNWDRLYK